jgi:4-diphosphocytidyl-2-C-methyl-D-erythritol kinase
MSFIHSVSLIAPAKVNLSLMITGRTPDGRHRLAGRTAFAVDGDFLTVTRTDISEQPFTLQVTGEYAKYCPNNADNLIAKAFALLQKTAPLPLRAGIAVRLVKNLPVASGIGGGSSDAAAFISGYIRLLGLTLDAEIVQTLAFALGADVPMCLYKQPCHIAGAGEITRTARFGGRFPALLINPNKPLSTAAVFTAYRESGVAFSDVDYDETDPFSGHNDLLAPAVKIIPEIAEILALIREISDKDSLLKADMSGSGATCFAVYHEETSARIALQRLKARFPNYFLRQSFFHV